MMKNNFKLLVLVAISLSLFVGIDAAHAQETQESTITPELIDGIKTSYLIAGVAIVGVLLQTYKGMIGKSRKDFEVNQLVFTVIVGIGAAIIVVGSAFENASITMTDTGLMIFLVQQVLTIVGAKTVTDIGKKFLKPKVPTEAQIINLEPIDDESDLPPGKESI